MSGDRDVLLVRDGADDKLMPSAPSTYGMSTYVEPQIPIRPERLAVIRARVLVVVNVKVSVDVAGIEVVVDRVRVNPRIGGCRLRRQRHRADDRRGYHEQLRKKRLHQSSFIRADSTHIVHRRDLHAPKFRTTPVTTRASNDAIGGVECSREQLDDGADDTIEHVDRSGA